ncbi:hypothetical protein ARMSODRAFT_977768 [Armillaria solidipes]|uniref:Uncharacterized protein n=1 Tax=Armillaria solidipes TaxID=1076256 RepID=A0A2H3B5E5_9AGAR|nr:hypothetical protein ARMSODRAFT_977768 [Armillaria solidipes]
MIATTVLPSSDLLVRQPKGSTSPPGKLYDAKPSGIYPNAQAFFGDRKNFGLGAGNATTLSVQQFQVIDVSIVADNPNGSAPMSSSVSSGSMHVAQYSGSVGRIGIRIGIHAIVNLPRGIVFPPEKLWGISGPSYSKVALVVVLQTACHDFNFGGGPLSVGFV